MKLKKPNIYLPGHGFIWHCTDSVSSPTQDEPPFDGGGCVHVLFLICAPGPHVVLHKLNPLQPLH